MQDRSLEPINDKYPLEEIKVEKPISENKKEKKVIPAEKKFPFMTEVYGHIKDEKDKKRTAKIKCNSIVGTSMTLAVGTLTVTLIFFIKAIMQKRNYKGERNRWLEKKDLFNAAWQEDYLDPLENEKEYEKILVAALNETFYSNFFTDPLRSCNDLFPNALNDCVAIQQEVCRTIQENYCNTIIKLAEINDKINASLEQRNETFIHDYPPPKDFPSNYFSLFIALLIGSLLCMVAVLAIKKASEVIISPETVAKKLPKENDLNEFKLACEKIGLQVNDASHYDKVMELLEAKYKEMQEKKLKRNLILWLSSKDEDFAEAYPKFKELYEVSRNLQKVDLPTLNRIFYFADILPLTEEIKMQKKAEVVQNNLSPKM